jgi:opacity protein-like surface antigen
MNKTRSILLLVVASALLLSSAACANQPESPIYGQWRGMYENNEVLMIIERNGTITISTLGSTYTGTFTFDDTTTPIQFNMDYEGLGYIETIIEFVDENTIRIENNIAGDPRPTTFSDFVLLTRDK